VKCLSVQTHRAVGFVIQQIGFPRSSRVYELSSKGALLTYLRSHFDNVYLSEFFEDVPSGGQKRGIPCQDVQDLVIVILHLTL
jgi:hypothetical protein